MTATTAPEITDGDIDEAARWILAEERKPPGDRWYNQRPFKEESDVR